MRTRSPAIVLLLLLPWAALLDTPPAGAVVIAEAGDPGLPQETNPADDPGWNHLAAIPGITAVYLGNGWAITAAHRAPDDGGIFNLPSGGWTVEPGTQVDLVQDADQGWFADLTLFRIAPNAQGELPDLPVLPIRSTPPTLADDVVMIGRGHHRGTRVGSCDGSSGWSFSQQVFPMHWGTNTVSEVDYLLDGGGVRRTTSFRTLFDPGPPGPSLPTPHEAQAADGDSGGGVFIHDGNQWELAGVMLAISRCSQNPFAAIRGESTYIADLSVYRSQIMALVSPPQVPAASPWLAVGLGLLLGGIGVQLLRRAAALPADR